MKCYIDDLDTLVTVILIITSVPTVCRKTYLFSLITYHMIGNVCSVSHYLLDEHLHANDLLNTSNDLLNELGIIYNYTQLLYIKMTGRKDFSLYRE